MAPVASTKRPYLMQKFGRVAPTPPSIVTKLWYCDTTSRSNIVTEQELSLAVSTVNLQYPVLPTGILIYTIYIGILSKCLVWYGSFWFGVYEKFDIFLLKVYVSLKTKFVILQSVNRETQCRINNSSKCSNCYGLCAFWGPAVFCNISPLLHYA